MERIFIVEDDPVIARQLSAALAGWGYETRPAERFERVLEEFERFDPQLVLLDIALPGRSGYYWCQEIRKRSKVPVVFLSSASENMNIVTAMHLGGDDFIAKPFDLAVLIAKVQAVLRRAYSFRCDPRLIECGGARLDLDQARCDCPGGRLELTKNEFRILQMLMENAGHVVSRNDLITRLWESESFIDDNTLTVNVTRLRRRLEEAGLPGFIRTKKGMGYYCPADEPDLPG